MRAEKRLKILDHAYGLDWNGWAEVTLKIESSGDADDIDVLRLVENVVKEARIRLGDLDDGS